MDNDKKYYFWIICILVIAGLGCSLLYSTQLFDGVKTAKTFGFIVVVCLLLFILSVSVMWKKKDFTISLSLPDILLALYAVWVFIRLLTSSTDSVCNLFFGEFSACVFWYFCLRSFFSTFGGKENYILFSIIVLGYGQLIVCLLQLTGIMNSFSPIFPVSGTFDNTSELCIYLTCILPVAASAGIRASDTTSAGKFVRAVCLIYVLGWLTLVLTLGSRTSLLAGLIGIALFIGFQTGLFGYLKKETNSFAHKMSISTGLLLAVCGLAFMLTQYKKDSANGRLLIWKVAWSGIKESPVQGQGFNAFQAKYGHYQAAYFQNNIDNTKEVMLADNMSIAMNDYIEAAFNLGIIGLLLFIAFWLSLCVHVIAGLTRNLSRKLEITGDPGASSGRNDIVAAAILAIFLISSGFYFVERMLAVKAIVLFFAAYAGSAYSRIKNYELRITDFHIRFLPAKVMATMLVLICCFAGYMTINRATHYVQWKKAETLGKFGYTEKARAVYEKIYPRMQHNGLFLSFYARNLYESKAYQQCIEYMERAKPQVSNSGFYMLLGDACFKTEDYDNAISSYQYAAYMVPSRFRPLHKQFKLYEKIGDIQKALEIAHILVSKPVKIDSNEVQEIIKECKNFIRLNKYKQNE